MAFKTTDTFDIINSSIHGLRCVPCSSATENSVAARKQFSMDNVTNVSTQAFDPITFQKRPTTITTCFSGAILSGGPGSASSAPVFSKRELLFTFAICYRLSVCLSSVTFVRPTQVVQIFGNISTALGTLAIP